MERAMKRTKTILLVLAFVSSAMLAGCNTIEGACKDIKKAGEKIEDAAKH
jgi:predicted small secreted protein